MSAMTRPASRDGFEVAIICALTLEADAVSSLFDDDWDDGPEAEICPYDKAPNDPNAYSAGRIGRHHVVVAHMPGMGKVHAAAMAVNCRTSWPNLRLALVVGICGAVPSPPVLGTGNEIILGDVVISSGIVQYDFGRRLPENFIRKDTILASLGRPAVEIRSQLAKLQGLRDKKKLLAKMRQHLKRLQEEEPDLNAAYPGVQHDCLYEASYRHVEDGKTCDKAGCNGKLVQRIRLSQGSPPAPTIHFGLVASGDSVMKSGKDRDDIAEQEDIIAFEMEGAGVCDNLSCIVIKGACDYADSHKTKSWQNYAAATAASYTKAFLEFWTPSSRALDIRLALPVITAPELKVFSMIPFTRNESFINREAIWARLPDTCLNCPTQSRTALFGLGGSGKTQIAVEYAYQVQDKNPRMSVFWIHAATIERFRESYIDLAFKCKIPGHDDAEMDTMKLVRDWITENTDRPWLIVLDNVDDAELLRTSGPLIKYIPDAPHVSLLITSRNKQASLILTKNKGKDMVEVGSMTEEESRELLCVGLGKSDSLPAALWELSERLERLPLALVQATSFIEAQSITVSMYLKLLNSSNRSFMRLLDEDFETVGRHVETLQAVAQTWVLSFEQIQRQNAVAAELLSLICFYDKHDVDPAFLKAHLIYTYKYSNRDEEDVDFQLLKAVGILKSFSFVASGTDGESLTVHRFVQLVTRKWLQDQAAMEKFASQAMFALSDCFPDVEYKTWEICRRYLPHAESVLRFQGLDTDDERQERADLLFRKSRYLFSINQWDKAELDGVAALQIERDVLGSDHSDTLAAMDSLALVYRSQNRFDEAEQLQVEAKNIRKRTLGLEHPDTVINALNLARTYMHQARSEEMSELTMATWNICKDTFGAEAWETIMCMESTASVCRHQSKLDEAAELSVAVMNYCKQNSGPDHPDTLTAMSEAALAYWGQGRLAEAEELEVEVLAARKVKLGLDHHDTYVSMRNLAFTWWESGRRRDAIVLMQDCANRQGKILGLEHPMTEASYQQAAEWLSL